MSNVLPIIQWDQAYNRNGDGKLPRAVMNVIRTYMNNSTLTYRVSQETLVRDTGLSESQVRRQIRENEKAGWLTVKRGRSGRASKYQLTYPQPVIDDRLDVVADESLTGHIRPVDLDSNRSLVTGYDTQPVIDDRLEPVIDDTLTTSDFSKEKSTTHGNGVANDTIGPDPFGGSVPSVHLPSIGEPSNGAVNDTIASWDPPGSIPSSDPFLPPAKHVPTSIADVDPWEPSPQSENIIEWPSGVPLPIPRDPFSTYVDATTGEVLAT